MTENQRRSRAKCPTIAVAVVVIDWATKWWAHHMLKPCPNIIANCAPVQASDHVRLLLEQNAGSALGFSQNLMVWALFSAVGLLLALFLTRRVWVPRTGMLDMSLLVGGAFANAVERIFFGSVIDFIALGPIGPTGYLVVNVADVALLSGAAAATFKLARDRIQDRKQSTGAQAAKKARKRSVTISSNDRLSHRAVGNQDGRESVISHSKGLGADTRTHAGSSTKSSKELR